ncbi:hypothetical protein [Mycobacteroides franklinii]|uniref:hypothetical protein n=1 Tax=Mycobacteroides franklinii TaxID=948102 RepID=UPI0009938BCA|nr:hypothetical protein [Mycobacteroides franklinii]
MSKTTHGASVKDIDAITAMLNAGQKRCRSFCTYPSEVLEHAARADKALKDMGLRASQRTGAVVVFTEAGPWSKSYNNGYGAQVTEITLRRFHDGWRLVKVERVRARNKQASKFALTPPTQPAAVAA